MLKTKNILDHFNGVGMGKCIDISDLSSGKSIHSTIDSGSATIIIQISNTGQDNDWMDYVQLSPSSIKPDGITDVIPWYFMRASVTSNSSNVTVIIGG